MDKEDWLAMLFFTILFVCIMGFVYFIVEEQDRVSDLSVEKEKWFASEHTCPACGWTGYPGSMVTKGGESWFDSTYYYCPQCGAYLEKW